MLDWQEGCYISSQVMRNQNRILFIFVLLTTGISAQQVSDSAKQVARRRAMGERDKVKENQIAKLFETIRADAKILQLTRIEHRDMLEQRVCTLALRDTVPPETSTSISAFYRTALPETVSAELHKVASFNDLNPKHSPSYTRYSVAVWRASDSQTGETMYWVGIHLYWSAVMEFYDTHFTDDIYYRNEWKKSIAAECRGN